MSIKDKVKSTLKRNMPCDFNTFLLSLSVCFGRPYQSRCSVYYSPISCYKSVVVRTLDNCFFFFI